MTQNSKLNLEPSVIYQDEVQQFLIDNKNEDPTQLAFKTHRYPNLPMGFLLDQIQIRKKGKQKLPTLLSNPYYIFPTKLNYEQCSSEQTAAYKASLVSGKKLIDLTGGIGVDDYFFAQQFESVIHVEQDETVSAFAAHNFKALEQKNIVCQNTNAEALNQAADVIYLDPARRSEDQKVFRFEDCSPNILELQDSLFAQSEIVLIKTSPLIDIKQSIKELKWVKEVHVVAVRNECKEILFLMEKGFDGEPLVVSKDLEYQHYYQFAYPQEEAAIPAFAEQIKTYLYEPSVAVLKSGAFKVLSEQFALKKLGKDTHLYTSDAVNLKFPGAIYKVNEVVPFGKKAKKLGIQQANIKTRNFTLTPDQFKKYLGVKKDGGDTFLFGTSLGKEKVVMSAIKA